MAIHEFRISPNSEDPGAQEAQRLAALHGHDVEISTSQVYYVEGVTDQQATALASLFTDPVTQQVNTAPRENWHDPNHVEVAPLPGTTNPAREPILLGARLYGVQPSAVESGREYHFPNGTPGAVRSAVVSQLLMNPNIEQVRTERPHTLVISGEVGPIEQINIRDLSDDELLGLSAKHKTALNLGEMRNLQAEARRMGRELTDGELRYMGGRWSEHCCHKTTKAELLTEDGVEPPVFSQIQACSTPYFEKRGVLSAYEDNSGVVSFYKRKAFNIKLETHNSPRHVEPRNGAATGTGGVLRDINATAHGALPISSMHMDFMAPPDMPESDVLPGTHHPAVLLNETVGGVGGYGNRMGTPTNNGSFHIHPNYRGKSTVLVGSIGILEAPEEQEETQEELYAQKGVPLPGDLVIAVGGRTGRDGIGGATFSSIGADGSTAETHAGAVQVGEPITQIKMFNAVKEASRKGLLRAMTDCGAAGFASAIGELGEDIGVQVDLAKAPLKYSGLAPWEIWVSESQERNVLAVAPEHAEEVIEIFRKHASEATVLGTFGTPDGEPRLQVTYNGQSLVNLDYEFIKHGLGRLRLEARWTPPEITETESQPVDWDTAFKTVLSDWNVCSKAPIVRRYDQEVQGMSAMKSYDGVHGDGPNNAAVMTPIFGEPYAIVQAHGCNPTLCELDPAKGSKWSYVEGMSNYVAAGGNPDDAVIVNNYITAVPTPRVMGALRNSVRALAKCVHEFESPIISGKDSLSSTFENTETGEIIESPYNLVITVAGKLPDVMKTVSTDIKKPGSTLVFIGQQDLAAMGGSVYYDRFGGSSAHVPDVDLPAFHQTATTLHAAMQSGKVLSAHDVSEGGVAVTLSEMLFGGDCGADIAYDTGTGDPQKAFFNETPGCFVVEVRDEQTAHDLFGTIPYQIIGTTKVDKTLDISLNGHEQPSLSVDALKQAWKQPFERVLV